MNESDLIYLASALAAVGLWACGILALWVIVEASHWVYCKARKIRY